MNEVHEGDGVLGGELVPCAQLVVCAGCGEGVWVEQACRLGDFVVEEVGKIVSEFLRGVMLFSVAVGLENLLIMLKSYLIWLELESI